MDGITWLDDWADVIINRNTFIQDYGALQVVVEGDGWRWSCLFTDYLNDTTEDVSLPSFDSLKKHLKKLDKRITKIREKHGRRTS